MLLCGSVNDNLDKPKKIIRAAQAHLVLAFSPQPGQDGQDDLQLRTMVCPSCDDVTLPLTHVQQQGGAHLRC